MAREPDAVSPQGAGDSARENLSTLASLKPWSEVREAFVEITQSTLGPWATSDQQFVQEHLAFAIGRLDDGLRFLRYFELDNGRLPSPPRDLLDIGTGTGGVAFAFANSPNYRVSGIDIGQNQVLRRVASCTGLSVRYALASGHDLPYADQSFDIVLLLDTLEHVPHGRRLGREIIRVLRPGGVCLITTPARVRYLVAPDPHYGIRYLCGLPNPLQRFVVNRVANRRIVSPDGRSWPAYDVQHLYWHVREITRLFPGPKVVDVLFAAPPVGGPFLSSAWWHRKLRNFLFDHVLVYKTRAGSEAA